LATFSRKSSTLSALGYYGWPGVSTASNPSYPTSGSPAISKKMGFPKTILQPMATPGNEGRRIVALEKVAGSSPVGHLSGFVERMGITVGIVGPADPQVGLT
jgi:hypothetical protein